MARQQENAEGVTKKRSCGHDHDHKKRITHVELDEKAI